MDDENVIKENGNGTKKMDQRKPRVEKIWNMKLSRGLEKSGIGEIEVDEQVEGRMK